jgi:ectoine hydroxylase-related dioxygenase (phytanoyl-CoA dioxygenase family)
MHASSAIVATDDLRAFRRDGFQIVRELLTPAEVRDISMAIDRLAARPAEIGRQMAYFEASVADPSARILSRIEKFAEYEPRLGALVQDRRILDRLAGMLGDEPILFKDKVNFKLPGGAGFTPHQDIQPGWDRYAPYYISVLIAVDANTIENGCLELAAGAHTRGLIGRHWEPLEGAELDGLDFVAYPMAPGDAAFFDCFAPHQSKPNLTTEPRRNLYLTYNRRRDGDWRERYFADKRASFPPDFERDPNATYTFRV